MAYRKTGEGRWLSARQESPVRRRIIAATPDQLKLPFMLWERRAVQEHIAQRFELQLPLRAVGEYLARWGGSCQRPAVRFYEQQPSAVRRWLKETSGDCRARSPARRGNPLGGRDRGDHQQRLRALRLNGIASVTNPGKARFMIYRQNFTAQIFLKFPAQIIRGAQGQPVKPAKIRFPGTSPAGLGFVVIRQMSYSRFERFRLFLMHTQVRTFMLCAP